MNLIALKKETIITNSFEETREFGEDLARSLLAGSQKKTCGAIIALYGDLGSGKTTFTQGLAKGLGIERNLNSPTFIIVRKYRIRNQKSEIRNLCHIDLYRVNNKKEIRGLGMEEIINDKSSVVVIEWAEKMEDLLPKKRIDIKFEYLEENRRKITIV